VCCLLKTISELYTGHPVGLIQRPKRRWQAAMQHRLVQMQVGLNQPWNDCATASVNAFNPRYLNRLPNRSDLAISNANIHERLTIPNSYIVNQQIHFFSRRNRFNDRKLHYTLSPAVT
jgi:hypothetical protein